MKMKYNAGVRQFLSQSARSPYLLEVTGNRNKCPQQLVWSYLPSPGHDVCLLRQTGHTPIHNTTPDQIVVHSGEV